MSVLTYLCCQCCKSNSEEDEPLLNSESLDSTQQLHDHPSRRNSNDVSFLSGPNRDPSNAEGHTHLNRTLTKQQQKQKELFDNYPFGQLSDEDSMESIPAGSKNSRQGRSKTPTPASHANSPHPDSRLSRSSSEFTASQYHRLKLKKNLEHLADHLVVVRPPPTVINEEFVKRNLLSKNFFEDKRLMMSEELKKLCGIYDQPASQRVSQTNGSHMLDQFLNPILENSSMSKSQSQIKPHTLAPETNNPTSNPPPGNQVDTSTIGPIYQAFENVLPDFQMMAQQQQNLLHTQANPRYHSTIREKNNGQTVEFMNRQSSYNIDEMIKSGLSSNYSNVDENNNVVHDNSSTTA